MIMMSVAEHDHIRIIGFNIHALCIVQENTGLPGIEKDFFAIKFDEVRESVFSNGGASGTIFGEN